MGRTRYMLAVFCLCVTLLGACQYVSPTGIPSTTWIPLPTVPPPATEAPTPPTDAPTLAAVATVTALPKPTSRSTMAPTESQPKDRAAWARDLVWQHLLAGGQVPDAPQFPEWVETKREELLDNTRLGYQAQGWVVTISVPLVASGAEPLGYPVEVSQSDGFVWNGVVQPTGAVKAQATPTPTPTPKVITAWQGTLHKLPDGSSFDDYFQVLGDGGGQYGVASSDAILAEQLEALADSGRIVRISGTLERDADDYGNAQIQVTELAALSPLPTAQPASQIVEGWVGVIRPLPRNATHDDFFDGQQPVGQWGIKGAMAPISKELATYRQSGIPVRIWGVLDFGQDDYDALRITVLRIEPLR